MIFEIMLGFLGIAVIMLFIGFGFKQWFFTIMAGVVLFLLTALLWSNVSVDYHVGNTINTNYTLNNGTINASSQKVIFDYEPITGFDKDNFALFTLLLSIVVLYIGILEQNFKGGGY